MDFPLPFLKIWLKIACTNALHLTESFSMKIRRKVTRFYYIFLIVVLS